MINKQGVDFVLKLVDELSHIKSSLSFLGFWADNSYANFSYSGHNFSLMVSDPYDKNYNFENRLYDCMHKIDLDNLKQLSIFDL